MTATIFVDTNVFIYAIDQGPPSPLTSLAGPEMYFLQTGWNSTDVFSASEAAFQNDSGLG